jgi:hypothetical protein
VVFLTAEQAEGVLVWRRSPWAREVPDADGTREAEIARERA